MIKKLKERFFNSDTKKNDYCLELICDRCEKQIYKLYDSNLKTGFQNMVFIKQQMNVKSIRYEDGTWQEICNECYEEDLVEKELQKEYDYES